MSNQKIVTETALSALASDIKTALSGKANSNDVYLKSQTYNRTEIDDALNLKADKSELYNVYPTDQESGAIASFTDGADNIPVKSLASEIVAVESGNGQPKSPDNPYTISGFNSGVVPACGINLWNEDYELGFWYASGVFSPNTSGYMSSKTHIPVKPNTSICVVIPNNISFYLCRYDKNKNFIDRLTLANPSQRVVQMTSETFYITFSTYQGYGTTYNNDISINYPSTDTSYHAYNGNTYTFTFGQTVYGGHFDNKGNLVVTHGYIASYNGETINEPWISSMDNYVPNTSPSTGAQVVYPLTTPTTLSIISQDIPTLLGENNIFSNCGNVEVKYFTEKSDGIAELIKAFM